MAVPSEPQGPAPGEGADPVVANEDGAGRRIGRRAVLGMIGLGAAGIVVGARVQEAISHAIQPITIRDRTGLSQYLPGSERFRIYSVTGNLPKPTLPYHLVVTGLVDRQLRLSLADLQGRLPQTAMTKDFQCVTGWRVGDVPWKGVLLRDVLDEAGVQAGAKALRFTSFDGSYTESLTLAQARRKDVLVAHQMLGKPVTREHGGPVRLYVAPMYGYKSIKWLGSIEVTDEVIPGYWEDLGYDVDGWIGKSNGRSDEPVE